VHVGITTIWVVVGVWAMACLHASQGKQGSSHNVKCGWSQNRLLHKLLAAQSTDCQV
jgi:hypothetical protein